VSSTRARLAMTGLATALLLCACKEPSKPADFAAEPDQAAIKAAPQGVAPVEVLAEEAKQPLAPVKECNLERANGQTFGAQPVAVAADATITLTGWLADAAARRAPGTFEVRMVHQGESHNFKVPAKTGGARPDVRTLLGGDAGFSSTGYSLAINPSALPTGPYRLYVVFQGADGLKVCDNGRAIEIR